LNLLDRSAHLFLLIRFCIIAECMFAWYWVADLCAQENLPFVLGHALYMNAIHGGKAKNDRIDAGKTARLLRGGTFRLAYVFPKGMREARGLLRRRTYLVRRRNEEKNLRQGRSMP
jgi:transposase